MNARDLKNSILQLAIQGKLVEQREEEGTAKELLEQIEEEKKKLVNEGRFKKQKKLEIREGETPFDIPESWEWTRLGELINISSGKGLTSKQMVEGDIPVFGGNGITGYHNIGNVNKETIVIGRVGYYCGSVHVTPNIAWVTDNAFITTYPEAYVYRNYLVYILRHLNLGRDNNATAQPVVSGKKIYPILFPLPPLEEQKRIVAKVEELMPYIDKYDVAYSEVEELNKKFPENMQKSILQYAIQGKLVEQREEEGTAEELYQQIQEEKERLIRDGKIKKEKKLPVITEDEIPFDIPENWKWVSIGQVCSNVMYGTSKKSSKDGKIAVLRMGNLQGGIIDYDNLVYSSDDGDIQKYKLEKNDLLFNRTNSRDLVGKTAIYKSELPAIYAGYLVRFTPVLVSSDYINYVMQSNYYWRYCQSVRSDAIGQSNINAEKLKRFVFPLPPLEEQKRIVAKIEELLPYTKQLVK